MLLQMELFYSLYCIYISHILIHSSVDGRLGCFHDLAVINSAAVNTGWGWGMCVCVSF